MSSYPVKEKLENIAFDIICKAVLPMDWLIKTQKLEFHLCLLYGKMIYLCLLLTSFWCLYNFPFQIEQIQEFSLMIKNKQQQVEKFDGSLKEEMFQIINFYSFYKNITNYLQTFYPNSTIEMLRKKNYKQQQHFTQLHTFSIYAPATSTSGPRKFQLYYKRYRKKEQSKNLYNVINNLTQKQENGQNDSFDLSKKFSEDRTLELLSFDGDIGFVKKYLRKIGKIRLYETGEGLYKGRKIYTAMCNFKFEFDLVKCFRDDYLQTKIDEACLDNARAVTQSDRQQQRHKLIQQHMGKQLKEKLQKLKDMQADGFQVVTDIYGQYRMDKEANEKFIEDLPQIKRKKKKQQKERKLREQLAKEDREEKEHNIIKF